MINIDDIKNLRREAELNELRLDHHQLGDLLDKFDERIAYYEKLRSIIASNIYGNYRLSSSSFIGPFLKKLADELTKDVLEGIEKLNTGPRDDCKVLEELEEEE